MRIKELYKILQANKNGKVTQSDIARATGTSRANVSKLFAKNSFLNDDKLKKIEEYFNINLKNAQSGLVYMDYFPDRVVEFTENNNIKLSDKSIKTAMPSAVFPYENGAEYFICHSNDDSMFPLINKGDFLIVKKLNTENINNKIYLFVYKKTLYIKRLDKNINQIVVFSENKEYKTQYISGNEEDNFYLLGEVVYIGRAIAQT